MNKMVFFVFGLIGVMMLSPFAHAQMAPIVLQTHLQPPYQEIDGSQLKGKVPELLACIFKQIDVPYAITIAPRKRNRALLKANRIDGFFLSIPDRDLDAHSVPSEPLALERWKYYYLKHTDLPEVPDLHVIGAVLGSNEEIWLTQKGGKAINTVPSVSSLVHLTMKNRIQYALADETTFEETARKIGADQDQFTSRFVRYVPLVAYFSKVFVEQNPDFMDRFNASLNTCESGVRETKEAERQYLLSKAKEVMSVSGEELSKMIMMPATKEDTVAHKHELDQQWKEAAVQGEENSQITSILNNNVSEMLRRVAKRYPEVTEIFLTDRTGFIVGMDRVTSDYWQGDEVAFQEIFYKDTTHHVSRILFDHSTRKFQVQLSFPVYANGSQEKLGMLTLGYDVNKAFSGLTF